MGGPGLRTAFTLLVAASMAGGCSVDVLVARLGEPSEADSGADAITPATDRAGSGSGTLVVVAEVAANNDEPNAMRIEDFSVAFVASVTRSGAPVRGASIRITSGTRVSQLEEGTTVGQYTRSAPEYAAWYTLDVVSGTDRVEGVVLVAPALHAFIHPQREANVTEGQPLRVSWAPTGAQRAILESRFVAAVGIDDSGEYTIPGDRLRIAAGGSGADDQDSIRVSRTREIVPAGGAPGSRFIVTVTNRVPIRLMR